MAYQNILTGSSANDGTGDTLRNGAIKVNANFLEVYNALGNGTSLSSGITADATNVTLTAPILSGITTTASGNLQVKPATYTLEVQGDGTLSGTVGHLQLNCSNNSHGQKVASQPHGAGDSGYFLLPKSSTANKDGTGGIAVADVLLTGDKTVGTTETVNGSQSGKDAISIDTLVTLLNTSSYAADLTLAAGVVGQIKIISMHTAGNAATLDVSDGNLAGMSTSIVWDAVGESVTLLYNGAKWVVVGQFGVSIT